ncbi:unnamed protein product [Rhodiola kirilowii]
MDLEACLIPLYPLSKPLVFLLLTLRENVRKQEDAKHVVESTVEQFGKLDILVNNAAANFLASPEDLSPNGFRKGCLNQPTSSSS